MAEALIRHDTAQQYAESSILGAILADPGCIVDLERRLRPDHFGDEVHSRLYATALQVRRSGRLPDAVAIAEHIDTHGDLREHIGPDWYPRLCDLMGSYGGYNLQGHVDLLIAAGERRRLQQRLELLQQSLADPSTDISDVRQSLQDAVAATDQTALRPVSTADLFADELRLREPIVDGICRRGEVVNIIAAAKVGKSWLSYGLLFAVATGQPWHGHSCRRGRALLIDNELHPELLSSRLRTVGDAMGLQPSEYATHIDVLSLRGQLIDIYGLRTMLQGLGQQYAVIVLDALYRLQPAGHDENSNGGTTAIYNTLDQYAAMTNAAIVVIHHASKGNQAGKAVTDVGSGAGSMSRAADTHLVLRQHEQDDCVVMEAAVRSFAPITPTVLRWEFPLWRVDGALDPAALQMAPTRTDERQSAKDNEGFAAIIDALRTHGPMTPRKLRATIGTGPDRLNRLLAQMRADGRIVETEVMIASNPTTEISLPGFFENT